MVIRDFVCTRLGAALKGYEDCLDIDNEKRAVVTINKKRLARFKWTESGKVEVLYQRRNPVLEGKLTWKVRENNSDAYIDTTEDCDLIQLVIDCVEKVLKEEIF